MNVLEGIKLIPGYAETSTRRHPVCPETVVVGERECSRARCLGAATIDGRAAWLVFRIPGERRFYFQHRPW